MLKCMYPHSVCKQKTWQGMWFNNLDVDPGKTSRHMQMSASGILVTGCYIGVLWTRPMCSWLGVTMGDIYHLGIVLLHLVLIAPEATPQLSHTWQLIISCWRMHQLLDYTRKSTRYYRSYSFQVAWSINELINVMP